MNYKVPRVCAPTTSPLPVTCDSGKAQSCHDEEATTARESRGGGRRRRGGVGAALIAGAHHSPTTPLTCELLQIAGGDVEPADVLRVPQPVQRSALVRHDGGPQRSKEPPALLRLRAAREDTHTHTHTQAKQDTVPHSIARRKPRQTQWYMRVHGRRACASGHPDPTPSCVRSRPHLTSLPPPSHIHHRLRTCREWGTAVAASGVLGSWAAARTQRARTQPSCRSTLGPPRLTTPVAP